MYVSIFAAAAALMVAPAAQAHCDTLDGPVATAAKTALTSGDLTPVLRWVKPEGEAEVRQAFNEARTLRAKLPEGRDYIDRYFYETVVRVHRAGEGAPYTGLKPAGSVEPAVAAADKAIEGGSAKALAQKLAETAEREINARFARLKELRSTADKSVAAGRAYVAEYVSFVHYVEGLDKAVHGTGGDQASPAAMPGCPTHDKAPASPKEKHEHKH